MTPQPGSISLTAFRRLRGAEFGRMIRDAFETDLLKQILDLIIDEAAKPDDLFEGTVVT